MSQKNNKDILTATAQVISDVFSPIVLPTYMMAAAMWITPLVVIPETVRIVSMGVIAVLTSVIPVAAIFTLIKLGKVSDVSISDRTERFIPYSISIVCYLLAALFLHYIHAPMWLSSFYIGAALTSLAAVMITGKWKISAHSSAVGGFAAAMLWLGIHDQLLFGAVYWVAGAVLLCGLVGTSRLVLDRHTPAQVFAGFALGACAIGLTMIIL